MINLEMVGIHETRRRKPGAAAERKRQRDWQARDEASRLDHDAGRQRLVSKLGRVMLDGQLPDVRVHLRQNPPSYQVQ